MHATNKQYVWTQCVEIEARLSHQIMKSMVGYALASVRFVTWPDFLPEIKSTNCTSVVIRAMYSNNPLPVRSETVRNTMNKGT